MNHPLKSSIQHCPNRSDLQDALDYACAQGRVNGGWDEIHRLRPFARPAAARAEAPKPIPGLFHLNGGGLKGLKQEAVDYALNQAGGRQSVAARTLKISRSSLHSMLRRPRALVALALVLLSALLPGAAKAGEVALAWDASITPGCSNKLYCTTNSSLVMSNRALSQITVNCGTNTAVICSGLTNATTWRFGVTATLAGAESDLSTIIPVQVPAIPANARTLVLQYSFSLGQTNWPDAMFIRMIP